ncbi:MAG: hypothetical protein NTY37_08660 [Methanothrix sp.]|nr:hypothetical protein [Methanothrix sp.]
MIDKTFEKEFLAVSSIVILARLWAAAPGSGSPVPNRCLGSRLRSWPAARGPGRPGCGAVVRAGWLARQALVSGSRRLVGPEDQAELDSC